MKNEKLQRPTEKKRLIDLVDEAGFDTSDWYNMKNGATKAASNPKYCYEWSFRKNDSILLNLWFEEIKKQNDTYFQKIEINKIQSLSSTIQNRAIRMFEYIEEAFKRNLPVRVIVLDGKISDYSLIKKDISIVKNRYLDKAIWAVSKFDKSKKTAIVERKFKRTNFFDQFSTTSNEKVNIQSSVYQRSQKVREKSLLRANGKCEFCNEPGFRMTNGGIYLETHHIIPLSQMGKDNIQNIICLCPNHHKEAHYSLDKTKLQNKFQEIINRK